MKVKMQIPTGALVKIVTKDGKTLGTGDVRSIEIEPFFSMANGASEVLHCESVSATDTTLDNVTITASGANGKFNKRARIEKGVVPLVDRPKKPAGGSTKEGGK